MASDRFSYQVIEIKGGLWGIKADAIQSELNRHGAQGWELVSANSVGTQLRLIFKRAN